MGFVPSDLHVVACVTNPVRYASRYRLYRQFEARMKAAGVHLVVVEGAFRYRDWEVADAANADHFRVRVFDEIWHKENLLNIGIAHLPHDWKYVAWLDADVWFDAPDWPLETLHALQHYAVVQMWRDAVDRGPRGEVVRDKDGRATVWRSFGSIYAETGTVPNKPYSNLFGHPGYAWAARREAIDAMGGLMDRAILGAADHHMALGLVGSIRASVPKGGLSPGYYRMLELWQEHASVLQKNLGFVPLTLNHEWHGRKVDRRYVERWDILRRWAYDPETDIAVDAQRVLRLTPKGVRMRDDLRRYFRARNEDSIDLD